MIGDTENPLTEVALALSMAFFSLMVLMLFAITNSSSGSAQQTVKVDGPASNEVKKESPTFLIFFNGKYFDETLEPAKPGSQDEAKPLLLAVMPDLDVRSMMDAMQKVNHPSPEVITLSNEWIRALSQK
tara:strand:- start:204 stop:590 length:387 start_codon:yes stop_codon:yes gene_type:complete